MRRREFLALGGAGLLLPRLAQAADAGGRRFFFLFCEGGWDPSYVMAPLFDAAGVDTEEDAEVGSAGGLEFVDHEDRPTVRAFFEANGDRTVIVNGIEVPSVTHGRCTRFLFTGQGDSGGDDWPTILAARSSEDLLMPHAVISGPAFAETYGSHVVRLGPSGQLVDLLDPPDGLMPRVERQIELPTSEAESAVDAYLRERAETLRGLATDERQAAFHETYGKSLRRASDLREFGLVEGSGSSNDPVMQTYNIALDALQDGLSRCAIATNLGRFSAGWDTHSENIAQSEHFELLFGYLQEIMDEMDSRPGPAGGTLAEETVLVVCSEMGRGPLLNAWGGKDHHPWTSMMIIGGGISGGRTVGAFQNDGRGAAVSWDTGEVDDSGTTIHAADVGASLLALGDVDPAEYVAGTPLPALMD
ncbi:MAG: DUF1501 domain-containing protein [Proteobacteria bacterium]|nr:DUF1501 domain-containing protein [Pseudomonadota bacterium]MCP4919221.1 DUF1501 domain-containing protein [Pseudomonadota bacterium]